MSRHPSRRYFLQGTLATASLAAVKPLRAQPNPPSPNEKVNVALIGVGGKGTDNHRSISATNLANIVALADIDENFLNKAAESQPHARKFNDWRKMLDAMHKDVDAVVVTTPDHMHAFATMAAIKLGKHVYCEKPLTHSIWEARQIREAAAKYKVATQMGNSGHSSEGTRLFVEWIRAGAIGNVREVHVWSDRPNNWWPQGVARPTDTPPVPAHLNWDMWLGPAPERAYHPAYHPFKWRGWADFGTGALGDMGCHIINASFWALDMDFPSTIEADTTGYNGETYPAASTVTYTFPAKANRPAFTLTWYDGGRKPARPEELEPTRNLSTNGTLVIGDKGKLLMDQGGGPRLLPESRMKDFQRPDPTLPRVPDGSRGHHRQWLLACKGGPTPGSNFDHAGRLTEIVLAGNVAIRAGKKLTWDGQAMRATNAPEAAPFIHREYRRGWTL